MQPEKSYQRLAQINETLRIPLIIHDGTGLWDDQFRQPIANGVTRINYHTALTDTVGTCGLCQYLLRPVAGERISIDYQTIELILTQQSFTENP